MLGGRVLGSCPWVDSEPERDPAFLDVMVAGEGGGDGGRPDMASTTGVPTGGAIRPVGLATSMSTGGGREMGTVWSRR